MVSGKCVWYQVGKEAVPIRWVIIRDPHDKFETQAIFSTRTEARPKQIVEWFIQRWQVEVTFEESRKERIKNKVKEKLYNPIYDQIPADPQSSFIINLW